VSSWTIDIARLERRTPLEPLTQAKQITKGFNQLLIHEATHAMRDTTVTGPHSNDHDRLTAHTERVEWWLSRASNVSQGQKSMQPEAKGTVNVDAETERAVQALGIPMDVEGSDRPNALHRKRQGELSWVGGWVEGGREDRC